MFVEADAWRLNGRHGGHKLWKSLLKYVDECSWGLSYSYELLIVLVIHNNKTSETCTLITHIKTSSCLMQHDSIEIGAFCNAILLHL